MNTKPPNENLFRFKITTSWKDAQSRKSEVENVTEENSGTKL